MSRGADNVGVLYQMGKAKSGRIWDIGAVVQNFNLSPFGIDGPNANDCADYAGRLKLDDIARLPVLTSLPGR